MALLDFTRSPSRSVAAADQYHSFVSTSIAAFAAWNDTRRTRNSLNQLSAHELEDIGLSRGDVDHIRSKRRF
ncbi:MAG: DUF1127 domain-containing protein [Boseongicola sp.]